MVSRAVAVSAVVLIVVASAAAGSAAHPAAFPSFLDCQGHTATVKPVKVELACSNGNFYVDKLKWRYWDDVSAAGTGRGHKDNCVPSCAVGHFQVYPVALRLFLPKTCKTGAIQFTRLSYQFVAAMPAKTSRFGTLKRPC
jgi:hypothetical protein